MTDAERLVDDIQRIQKKTDQAFLLFQALWERRLGSLETYFKKRYGFKFLFWQGKRGTSEELTLAFRQLALELSKINAREEKLLNVVRKKLNLTLDILERAHQEFQLIHQHLARQSELPGLTSMENHQGHLINLLKRFAEMLKHHEEILSLERDLVVAQSEGKWKLYLVRLGGFAAEMRGVLAQYNESKKERLYLADVQQAVEKLRNFSLRKPARTHIGPSIVSAIVRVFGATGLSQGILVSFGKVNYWELASLTTVFVIGINFTDYYFSWATNLSNQIAKVLAMTK